MRRVLLAAAALAVLVAGGCGIPDRSDVRVVADGPSPGPSPGEYGDPPVQYTRESTEDVKQFVQYYLQAAAGDPETAVARVKAFLAPEAAARFPSSGTDVRVVRETEDLLYTPGDPEVKLTVQQVGKLNSNGLLQPAEPTPQDSEYTLRIGKVAGRNGLFVLDAPQFMLLSDTALDSFYLPRTIYFWNNRNTGLVPDLRYMPRSVPTVQQPTTILGWLAAGPAPWLGDAVLPLPPGTQASDNVPAITNDTLTISLNAAALPPGSDAGALDRLRQQLQWSLRPLVPRTLELKIGREDAKRYVGAEYLESNPGYAQADVPERFVVYNGSIRRLRDSPHASDPVPVLKPAANKNIVSAALSSSTTQSYAAVVTGAGAGQRLRVGSAPAGQQSDLKEARGLTGTLGNPVWAQTRGNNPADTVGLITANGWLYGFDAAGGPAARVGWQGDPGMINAVSVAPDGQRVAVVSGGRLYRTVINTAGDGVALSAPEQVLPPILDTVAAVAWNSETSLVVAGKRKDGRYAVLDMTVDGALSTTRLGDIGATRVSYLTAYPTNPAAGTEKLAAESYVAGGEAWDVLSTPTKIEASDLAEPPPSTQSAANPTAPFFLD